MQKIINYSLYLIADPAFCQHHSVVDVVTQSIDNGVTIVQLRCKNATTLDLLNFGEKLKPILQKNRVPFIINDRMDIALALDADGVHLGQSDMPYPIARKILGKQKIIGLSIEDLSQLQQAETWDVDYLGVGPIFSTSSKINAAPSWGLANLKKVLDSTRHPIVAIGGINPANAMDLFKMNVSGIAILSAICSAKEPGMVCNEFRSLKNA